MGSGVKYLYLSLFYFEKNQMERKLVLLFAIFLFYISNVNGYYYCDSECTNCGGRCCPGRIFCDLAVQEAWKYCKSQKQNLHSSGDAKYCMIEYFETRQEEYKNCQYCVCSFIPLLC